MSDLRLLQNHKIEVEKIYVPAAKRKSLDITKVEEIAESMIEEGQKTAIQVREDGDRYVLIEGLHRLEACRLLDESSILALLVQARRR